MSKDGTWVRTTEGEVEFVHYDDLDTEVLRQLLKPVGGFCYSVDKFIRLPLAKAPFFVEGWLPRPGKMIIYAPAKRGKSALAVQLGRCIGSGVPFLGMPTSQGSVLILQFELGESVLQQRLINTGQSYSNVYIGTSFSMKLDREDGRALLLRAIEAINPAVLILDPFYKMFMGDENDAHDVKVVLDFLDTVMDTYNLSVVIMHHSGKDVARGGRGSSVFEGFPDAYIELKTTKDGHLLTPKLLRHSEPKPAIEIKLKDNLEFEVVGEITTIKDKLFGLVMSASERDWKFDEMSSALKCSRRALHDAIATMIDNGELTRLERGLYRVNKSRRE